MDLEKYETKNEKVERIPYIAYESALARNERTIKRLIISLVLSILLIFASNAVWLYVFSQYEYGSEETTTTTVKQDGKGQNVYGDGNELSNGTKDSNKEKETQEEGRK